MPETAQVFLKRLLYFSIGPGVSAFIGFLSMPITTWLVSPDDFGKASMYVVLHMLASLILFLGLDQAFVREFNVFENKRMILFHSVFLPLVFSAFLLALLLTFYKPLSYFLYGSVSFKTAFITVIPIPFLIVERFNLLIVRMEEKGKIYSLMEILRRIFDVCFLIGIVYFQRSFFGIILAKSTSICVSSCLSFLFVKSYWIMDQSFDKKLLNRLLRFGLPLVPATIIGWVLNAMDKVALRMWADFSEMGIYSAGFKIVSALLLFQAAFTTFWIPTAYRWYETGEPIRKFEKVSNLLAFFLCFAGSALILFRKVIILVLSPSYALASVVVPFLVFYPILYTLSETTVLGIAFSRRTELGIWVSLVAAGTNLLGNWLLVPKYGALGASIATAISYMVFFWMRTLLSRSVWEKIPIKIPTLDLILLVSISVVSSLQDQFVITDLAAYSGILVLISLLVFTNTSNLAYALSLLVKRERATKKDQVL